MLTRFFLIIKNLIIIYKIKKEVRKTVRGLYSKNEFNLDSISFLCSKDTEKIIQDAIRILEGEYQIYNFESYRNLTWNKDPVSGQTIKNALVVDLIRTSRLYNKVDIKNIWEQAHLHPLVTLAQAYEITGNLKYANKILDILIDFCRYNPCGQSVAWKCSMDSAIRVANIIHSVSKISGTPCFKKNEIKIVRCIYEHILYVSKNYENKGRYPNNHYLANLVGVIWGAVYLHRNYGIQKAKELYSDAIDRLNIEVKRQIQKDGFDYESSTYYHCFITELFAETVDMLNRNEEKVPMELNETTTKMLSCCKALGAFTGSFPLIGDQDGSRLFHLKGCFDINKCDFSTLSRFSTTNEKEDKNFGGIYILNGNNIKVYFKCGAIGTNGNGTHDHNDQLSVCVFINGIEVVCDSGTYCYTNNLDKRKKYRSVKAHSTVHFVNQEQNSISNVFAMETNQEGRLIRFDEELAEGVFAYKTGEQHSRIVSIHNRNIVLEDNAIGGVSRLVIPVSCSKIRRIDDYHVCFLIHELEVSILSNERIETQVAFISRAYGVEIEATYIDSICNGKHVYYITQG